MTGRKSRHYRGESDALLGMYSATISAASSKNIGTSPSNRSGSETSSYGSNINITPTTVPNLGTQTTALKDGEGHVKQKEQKKEKKRGGYRVHRVSYTAQNHVQILFRIYGSAFPIVLPFVFANVAWTLCVHYLKYFDILDLTFHSSTGHSFMGLLVSFLIVSRSQISYNRFMEYRKHLVGCYLACVSILCIWINFVYSWRRVLAEAMFLQREALQQNIRGLAVDVCVWMDHDATISKFFALWRVYDLSYNRNLAPPVC